MGILVNTIIFLSWLFNVAMSFVVFGKIQKIENVYNEIQKEYLEIIEHLYGDIEGMEKAIVGLSKKIDALPDMLKDEMHRSLLALRENLETAKPIKPNNWDSVKEAFKKPSRIEVNE